MAEQLRYDDVLTTFDLNVSMPRGEDRHLVGVHAFGPKTAIQEMRLTVSTRDDAETVVMSLALDENPDKFDLDTDDRFEIHVPSSLSVGVPLDTYKYGVEIIGYNGIVNTPLRGTWELTDDVVTNTGTAPYLSWATREDIDTDVDSLETTLAALAESFGVTYLATALSGGEGAITVQSVPSSWTGGTSIRVITNTGYEDEEIASIASTTITLVGTVSAAAAAGKAVRTL